MASVTIDEAALIGLTVETQVVEINVPNSLTIGGGGGGTFDGVHNDLDGRSTATAHPISAITDLQAALDARPADWIVYQRSAPYPLADSITGTTFQAPLTLAVGTGVLITGSSNSKDGIYLSTGPASVPAFPGAYEFVFSVNPLADTANIGKLVRVDSDTVFTDAPSPTLLQVVSGPAYRVVGDPADMEFALKAGKHPSIDFAVTATDSPIDTDLIITTTSVDGGTLVNDSLFFVDGGSADVRTGIWKVPSTGTVLGATVTAATTVQGVLVSDLSHNDGLKVSDGDRGQRIVVVFDGYGSGRLGFREMRWMVGADFGSSDGTVAVTVTGNPDTHDTVNLSTAIDASGFNGNLTTTDNTLQKVAQKVDDLATGGSSSPPSLPLAPASLRTNMCIVDDPGGTSSATIDGTHAYSSYTARVIPYDLTINSINVRTNSGTPTCTGRPLIWLGDLTSGRPGVLKYAPTAVDMSAAASSFTFTPGSPIAFSAGDVIWVHLALSASRTIDCCAAASTFFHGAWAGSTYGQGVTGIDVSGSLVAADDPWDTKTLTLNNRSIPRYTFGVTAT